MARPQSREADNRARSGRPNRSNGKPSTAQQISTFLFGPSDPRISQAGVGGYKNAIIKAAQAAINKNAKNIGRGIGDDMFDSGASQIISKAPNYGGKIKNTQSSIYTSGGSFKGKESFFVTKPRTDAQVYGTQRAQLTKLGKEAAKMESIATAGAKIGIKKGLKAGGAAGAAAGGAAGYQMGKRNNKKGSGGTGRK
jgi:hypothetical protein